MLKSIDLRLPMLAKLRATIQPNFAYVGSAGQQLVEKREFILPLMGDLGMQT